ncbi:response regulator transcription factor [Phytohabitans kaempferiae]|uniref:DNA-binding response regulator n=1 Tax=Phytohabitans kaempferiae TaxID=1620943 RepID=A0ABV6MGX9_9ACTN
MPMINIMLAAEPSLLRDGVRAVLQGVDDFALVGETSGGSAAVAGAASLAPDVVVLDGRAAGLSTAAALIRGQDPAAAATPGPATVTTRGPATAATRGPATVTTRGPATAATRGPATVTTRGPAAGAGVVGGDPADRPRPRIVLLAGAVDDVPIDPAARTGIDGYVLTAEAGTSLIAAVRAVAAGQAWLSPPFARRLLDLYRAAPTPRPRPAGGRRLSERERSVLRLVAHGRTNAEIAHELVLGESTVKTHVSRLLTKLELRDRVQLAVFAHHHGLT